MIESDVLDDCLLELPLITHRFSPRISWIQDMANNVRIMNSAQAPRPRVGSDQSWQSILNDD